MIISQLIEELEKLKNEHGDIPVLIKENGFGGYSMNTFGGLDDIEIYANEIEYDSNIKELFPKWDGIEESLDEYEPIKCITIEGGYPLYST